MTPLRRDRPGPFIGRARGPAIVMVIQWMLKVGALRNGFTYGKLFHQLEEIVSELLRYLWKIRSYAHQSFSCALLFFSTLLLLIYSLSSVQWCPLLQKLRTGSLYQHLPRRPGSPCPEPEPSVGVAPAHVTCHVSRVTHRRTQVRTAAAAQEPTRTPATTLARASRDTRV